MTSAGIFGLFAKNEDLNGWSTSYGASASCKEEFKGACTPSRVGMFEAIKAKLEYLPLCKQNMYRTYKTIMIFC